MCKLADKYCIYFNKMTDSEKEIIMMTLPNDGIV